VRQADAALAAFLLVRERVTVSTLRKAGAAPWGAAAGSWPCPPELWIRWAVLEAIVKTYSMKQAEIAKDWLVVDAADIPLGRLATRIATYLRGKHKPTFQPNLDMGDNVIVINAQKVKLTGQKLDQKVYLRYTGWMGGQKATPMRTMLEKHPDRVVSKAVWGMMPKTRLGRRQMTHLRVYPGAEHPHHAQQPKTVELGG
jgi:large subunit ribosomal protein L13